MAKNSSDAVHDDVIEPGGKEFKQVKNRLDEEQVVPFMNELINQRDSLAQRERNLTSLTKLAEKTITEAHKLAEEMKAEATKQAEADAVELVAKNDQLTRIGNKRRFKKYGLTLLMLCLVIEASLVLFIYQDIVTEFEGWGYLGVFLISVVGNATILLPMPGLLLVITIGTILNPVLVSLIAGLGSAIGELSGYIIGYSGRGITQYNRDNKWFIKADRWMKKRGTITIFVFALAPFLPFDVAGIVGGAFRFPVWKFLIACFFGKTLLLLLMVYSASWGWDFLIRHLS